MTTRVAELEAQRQLRDEMRYVLKLRQALQAVDGELPGPAGLARLNRDLDHLPRATWWSRWLG